VSWWVGELVNFRSAFVIALLLGVTAANARPQAQRKDPVTGNWGSDGRTSLSLKFDGKSRVSGTTIWRQGDTHEYRAEIRSGTFDLKNGTLKLEGEGKKPDGALAGYVIEGKIDNDTITGTYKFGDQSGPFMFQRL
jgi:hypothetical protein